MTDAARGASAPRFLVLYAHYAPTLSYYDDWLEAFRCAPDLSVTAVDLCASGARRAVSRALPEHDAVVLLHSTNGDTLDYLAPITGVLAARSGPLLAFVGNEVNLPGSPMADKIAFLREVGAEWILTQLPLEAGRWLYEDCTAARVAAVPHALEPRTFRPTTALDRRPIDIGVRSARYTAFLGDDERNRLFELFRRHAFEPPLRCDISTTERFARTEWAAFLNRCKGTISTEAGSWYLERDDRTVNAVREHVRASRSAGSGIVIAADSPLRRLGHRLPWRLRALLRRALRHGPVRHEALVNEALDFDEIHARFFAGTARAPVYSKAISSRHFDAIGTKTCQIMPRGRFNDILEAGRHYLALEPDLSNVDDVVAAFRDPSLRRRVVEDAYDLAMSAHTYAHRVAQVRALVAG